MGRGWGSGAKEEATPIVLRYYYESSSEPHGLRQALLKVTGVREVKFNMDRTATVSYVGRCDRLGQLELAAQNASIPALLVNHCHVAIGLTPQKGGDLVRAREEIAQAEGVFGMTVSGGSLELHADLTLLTYEVLRDAAARAKCAITINQTYEYQRYRIVEGHLGVLRNAAAGIKGIMFIRDYEDGTIGVWVNKAFIKRDWVGGIEGIGLAKM